MRTGSTRCTTRRFDGEKNNWNLLRYCVLWVPSSIQSRRLVRNEQDSRKQYCCDYSKVDNLFRISNVHVSSRSHTNHPAHFTISRRYIPYRSTDSYKTAISPHLPTYTFTSKRDGDDDKFSRAFCMLKRPGPLLVDTYC